MIWCTMTRNADKLSLIDKNRLHADGHTSTLSIFNSMFILNITGIGYGFLES